MHKKRFWVLQTVNADRRGRCRRWLFYWAGHCAGGAAAACISARACFFDG